MTNEQKAAMNKYDTLVHDLALIIARHQIANRGLNFVPHPLDPDADRMAPSFHELARELIAKMDWPPGPIERIAGSRETFDSYQPEALPEHLRWKGDGPPPASWWVGTTKVYRSYADYCSD